MLRALPALTLVVVSCAGTPVISNVRPWLPARIAFGSCSNQALPQPILLDVVERDPDVFVYLGDNIYGDTEDMGELRAKYEMLGSRPEFQALRAHCPLLATWDDHDYGLNDGGRHYPQKEASKEVFLDFWDEPAGSSRFEHAGIYHEERFSDGLRSVQVLLLDTRTFRDDLLPAADDASFKNAYRPNPDPAATILGEAQWAWLEEKLSAPADLRIIATSIQFGHAYNGWESWTNVPHERRRLIETIQSTRANGVVFISGDVHWGEISRQDMVGGYPLYDVTASGINQDWDVIESNSRRVGNAVAEHNVGWIDIDWSVPDPVVTLRSLDVNRNERNAIRVRLSELRFVDAAPGAAAPLPLSGSPP